MKNIIKSLILLTVLTGVPLLAKQKQSSSRTRQIMGCDQAGTPNGATGTYNSKTHTATLSKKDELPAKYTNVHRYKKGRSKDTIKFAYYPRKSKYTSKRNNTSKKNASKNRVYLYGNRSMAL